MQRKLTAGQIRQAELAALQKAVEHVKIMPLRLSEKLRAIETLVRTRAQLETVGSLKDDIGTSELLINFKKERHTEIEAVLHDNPPLMRLGRFGTVPGVLIQAVFKAAGTPFPIELQSFHAAYQEELRVLCGHSNAIAPLPTAKPA